MNDILKTDQAQHIYNELKPLALAVLVGLNEGAETQSSINISAISDKLQKTENALLSNNEAYLNDFYILRRYADFISTYCKLWEEIINGQFSRSWQSLQDALDLLRIIKKFSEINISFFEGQLTELEKAYPYNVFFSTGMVFDACECSICGKDIDSLECEHIRGELYAGKMAVGKVTNILRLDHVSMVLNPRDKRCVVSYSDDGEQFKAVRFIADTIRNGKVKISNFENIDICTIEKHASIKFSERDFHKAICL